jgi:putative SOS response-associated peptidase YedK
MHVGCRWSRWTKPGEPDLLSFGAITDEPPPEIEAVGMDRCIIPTEPENIEAWLNPSASSLNAMYAVLDNKDRPYTSTSSRREARSVGGGAASSILYSKRSSPWLR